MKILADASTYWQGGETHKISRTIHAKNRKKLLDHMVSLLPLIVCSRNLNRQILSTGGKQRKTIPSLSRFYNDVSIGAMSPHPD
jgi:hypothetical protein